MKKNDSEVLDRVEAQLEALNRKLDGLIKQLSQKPMERSSDFDRGFDNKGNKMQYKATCSECGKACDLPFKPSGGRPVFCSECFAKQRDTGREEPRFHKKPRDFRKSSQGKKPFFKKR